MFIIAFLMPAGYRSVPLKNAYSDEYELSCLLVHIDIRSAMVSSDDCDTPHFATMQLYNVTVLSQCLHLGCVIQTSWGSYRGEGLILIAEDGGRFNIVMMASSLGGGWQSI